MKRIFNYIAVFVAGIILGEIGIKSITEKVMKEISNLNMDSVIDVFSSREIASMVWLIIFFIFIFIQPKARDSAFKILQIGTTKHIVIPLVMIMFYSSLWVIVASNYSFWEWRYLKDVIFWVTFNGIPICFGAIINKDDNHYFANILKNNLRFIIIVEFLLSTFTFNISIELILMPCITFLVLLDTFTPTTVEHVMLKKLTSFVIAIIGFTVLGLTLRKVFVNYDDLINIDLLVTFYIPIVLSILFIPISYGYAVYSKYQELFTIMSFKEPENWRIRIMHRWEIIKTCKLSYRRVTKFRRVDVNKMYKYISKEDFIKIIENF